MIYSRLFEIFQKKYWNADAADLPTRKISVAEHRCNQRSKKI